VSSFVLQFVRSRKCFPYIAMNIKAKWINVYCFRPIHRPQLALIPSFILVLNRVFILNIFSMYVCKCLDRSVMCCFKMTCMRFEVLIVVCINLSLFPVVLLCSLVDRYKYLGGKCFFRL